MNPTYDFAGQVALVTGASSGMGLATARAFAAQGARVALADINEGALRATTDELITAGYPALAMTCDVSDEAQVATLVMRGPDGITERTRHMTDKKIWLILKVRGKSDARSSSLRSV